MRSRVEIYVSFSWALLLVALPTPFKHFRTLECIPSMSWWITLNQCIWLLHGRKSWIFQKVRLSPFDFVTFYTQNWNMSTESAPRNKSYGPGALNKTSLGISSYPRETMFKITHRPIRIYESTIHWASAYPPYLNLLLRNGLLSNLFQEYNLGLKWTSDYPL